LLAFAGLCADSDEEAERRILRHGAHWSNGAIRPNVWGGPKTCALRLATLLRKYRPDELMVFDLSETIDEKRESYRRWAEAVRALAVDATPRGSRGLESPGW
jgi:hypothetical protein